jgi:ribosome biogenesis GTPase / thiamine phosphate phosphatase
VPEPEDSARRALGWDDEFAAAAAKVAPDGESTPARVVRVDRGVVTVSDGVTTWRATFATPIATGDWVLVHDDEVVATVPRRTAFVRGDPVQGAAVEPQVVAANVDTVFVVQSFSNGPNLRRLERELVLAWQSGAAPVVVLNKRDVAASDADVDDAVASIAPIAADVPVIVTSAVTGAGIDALAAFAGARRTVALVGASGVGKSSLVNRLAGGAVQATAAVRERDQRGRHTTTARELVQLPTGGLLVDTPGLRAVSLWDADDGMERAFADVEALAIDCRFRDCRHEREPDCAVRRATDEGRLDPARFASYRRLHAELDEQHAQRTRARRRG